MTLYKWWKTKVKGLTYCVYCGRYRKMNDDGTCWKCELNKGFNNTLQRYGDL